ncbi:MAG: Fic family protein [Chloroflexi bacterium]|nr:Fic family protein [Chloroflexota bacterium]
MNVEAFKNSPTGTVVRTPTRYDAFIPNPLPPQLEPIEMSLFRLSSEAERALGQLGGIGYLVPNPDFLVIPYINLEAVASSRIEGTQASLSELFYFEAATEKPPVSNDITEVRNYVFALSYGLERLKTLPLSLRLVREIHEHLMVGTRGGTPDRTPGEFRRSQNWIGPAGCNLNDATFVPPPPDELMRVLGEWEIFLHDRQTLPLLIQCALIHYQFETIHPFLDGNGRVGRLLITLFLCERKALPHPLLYLSAFFEKYRDEYYDHLLGVSRDGDWKSWLEFFLRGIIVQSEHAILSAKRIIDQREQYRQKLQSEKASASVLALLDLIFTSPYLTTQQVGTKLNVVFRTAQLAIEKLERAGILEEITGHQRNRVYFARQLLELLAENEPIYRPS